MHIFISLKESKTSNFVKTKPFIPDTVIAFFNIKISNHPHLLFLPVTVPNSLPSLPNFSPTSLFSSVGNGPLPTLVVYAFVIPNIFFKYLGLAPDPVDALEGTVLLLVT